MLLHFLLNQLGGRPQVQVATGGLSSDSNSAGTFMELAKSLAANRPLVLVLNGYSNASLLTVTPVPGSSGES